MALRDRPYVLGPVELLAGRRLQLPSGEIDGLALLRLRGHTRPLLQGRHLLLLARDDRRRSRDDGPGGLQVGPPLGGRPPLLLPDRKRDRNHHSARSLAKSRPAGPPLSEGGRPAVSPSTFRHAPPPSPRRCSVRRRRAICWVSIQRAAFLICLVAAG